MTARRLAFPSSRYVRFLVILAVFGLFRLAVAQSSASGDKLAKAKKYHSILAKRPSPGYLFDRFYDAWLDQDTVEGLQAFLNQQVDAGQRANNSANRLLLAFFHAKQGNDTLALEEFRRALKDDPGNASLWYEKAVVEARTLDYDTALADLAKASEGKVDSKLAPKIAKLQGKLLVRSQQIDKAIETWQVLLKKNPRDEDLYEDIIDLQLNEGLYDQAAQLSESFVAKTRDPYKQVIRGIRTGDIYQRGGKSEKALEVYSGNLAKLGADSWIEKEVLAQIEQIFRREDDLVGLQKQFDKMLEAYPKRISIRKRYADLLADLGEKDAAIEQFKQILALTPGDRKNREEYIALLGRLENLPEATKQLEALIKQSPEDPELRVQLANLLDSQDKTAEAGVAVDQFLSVAEKSEYAYLRAARLLTRFELLDKANAVYESLNKTFPDSDAAKEALAAFLYDKREKQAEAIKMWQQIAAGQDRSQLVRVARILSGRREHQAAFDMLKDREDDFKSDPIYLGQLIASAVALKKFEEAIPWASRRVQAATSLADLEAAIVQGAEVVSKADKGPEIIAKMSKNPKPTTQQSCLLAELLEREGDSKRADEVLANAEAAQAAGRKLFVVSQQIRLLNQRREWGKAAEATKRLIGLPGGRKSIHVRRLVELYQRDLKFDEALKWTQQWKKLSPGSTLPWLTESRLLSIQGKSNEALDVLRARLAAAYAAANKIPDARRIYWRLYEDNDDVGSKLRWAQELSRLAQSAGNVDRLIGQLEERRTNNRQSIVPLLALAEVHRETGDYEKRRDALLEATRLKPNDVDLLFHIARVEETEGDWERSLQTLEKAAKVDKTSRSSEKMARLHLRYGDPDKGYAILFDLAGREKSGWQGIEAIADAMIGQQDWERAIEFLRPQLDRFPKNYRLAYMHASAVEEFGNIEEAAEYFVKLLDQTEEISGRQFGSGNSQSYGLPTSYLQQFNGIAPPGTAQYLTMMYQTRQVYSHRQGRRGGMAQSSLMMPPNVDSLRPFVLAHLLEIGRMGMDDAQLEDLDRTAAAKGVPNLGVLRRLFPSLQSRYQVDETLIEEFPDDESLLGLWVMTVMNRGNAINDKIAAKTFDTFKESYPQLAMMAGFQASITRSEMLEPTVELLAKVQQPSDYLLSMALGMLQPNSPFATAMNGLQADGAAEQYQKVRDELIKHVSSWYPKLQSNRQQAYRAIQLFSLIASSLKSQDPDEYLKFLDDEVMRYRAAKSKSNMSSMMASVRWGQPNEMLNPLTFPPLNLTNFPAGVLTETLTPELMQSASSQMQYQVRMAMQMRQMQNVIGEEEKELTEESVAKIKDGTLRVLFANKLGKNELVKKEIEQLLNSEQPTIDAFLLAASYAQSNDKSAEAMMLLEKGRHLPMDRATRKSIDAAMVASALAIEKLSDDEKKVAVDAALRLRAAKLNPQERQTLIPALASLGLEKEANKLEEQQAKLAMSGRGGSVSFSGGYGGGYAVQQMASRGGRGATDPITKMLKDGKRDNAIRAITNQLAAAATNMASNMSMGYGGRRSNFVDSRTRSLISRYKLKDDILKSVRPEQESANVSKLNRYASICLVLDEEDLARAAFEKVLAKRPKDMQTRLQLMMLTDDSEKMLEYAKGIDYRALPMIGTAVQQVVSSYEMDVDKRMNFIEGIRQHIDEMNNLEKTDLTWLANTTQQLGQHLSAQRANYYPLYYVNITRHNEGVHSELRRKVHDNLCRTLMKHPRTAEQGFTLLQAAYEAERQNSEHAQDSEAGSTDDSKQSASVALDFVELAKQALATSMKATIQIPNQSSRYYRSNGNQVPFHSPAEFLVRDAAMNGDFAYVQDELLPQLKKARRRDDVTAVEGYLSLYQSEPDEFLVKAKAYLKRQPVTNPPTDEASRAVVDVWMDRDLDVDIGPILLESLMPQVNSAMGYSPPAAIGKYASALGKKGGNVAGFIDGIAELYLGPKQKRLEFVKKNYNQRRISSGTPNARIHAFRNLIQQMGQTQELIFPVAMVTAELGLLRDSGLTHQLGQKLFYNSYNHSGEVDDKAQEQAKQLLACSVFTKDLDEFRALPEADTRRTVWGQVLVYLASNSNPDARKQIVEGAPKTFGWDLIRACAAEDPRSACLEFFASNRERIDASTDEKQHEVGLLASELLKQLQKQKVLDNELATTDWLRSLIGEEEQSGFAEKILKARNISQIAQDLQDDDKFREEMVRLIEGDKEKAKKLFFHLAKIAQKSGLGTGGGYISSPFGGSVHIPMFSFYEPGATVAGSILQSLMGRHGNSELDAKTLAFTIDLLATADPEIVLPDNFRYNLRNSFQRHQRGNNRLDGIKSIYQELGKELGDLPTSILALPLSNLVGSLGSNDRPKLISWAEEQIESGEYPSFAKEILAITKFDNARDEFNSAMNKWRQEQKKLAEAAEQNPGDATEATIELPTFNHEGLAYYMEVFADETLPITWRQMVATSLLERTNNGSNQELVLASVELMTKQKKDLIHPYNFVQTTLRQFFQLDTTTPEWKTTAEKLTEVWNKLILRPTGALARLRQTGNFHYGQEGVVLPMMAANVELGKMDDFMKLYRAFGQSFSHSNDLLGMMVRHDKLKEAKSLLDMRMQNNYQLRSHSQGLVNYSEELEARIPKFLAEIELVGERYAAEILLASLLDPSSANAYRPRAQTEDSPRAERVTAISKRFGEIDFDNDELKEAVLVLLLQVHPPSVTDDEAIRAEVRKQIAGFDVADSIDYRSNMLNQRQPLYQAYTRAALYERNGAELAKIIEDISAVETEQFDHGKRQLLQTIIRPINEALQNGELSNWKKEDFVPLAKVTQEYLDPKNEQMLNYMHEMSSLSVVLHALSCEHDAFEKAFASQTSKRQDNRRFPLYSLFNYLRGEPANVSQEEAKERAIPLERRVEIVGSLLRCVSVANQLQLNQRRDGTNVRMQNSGELLQQLRSSKLLMVDELTDHADDLAKVDGGWGWAMLASEYEKSNNRQRNKKSSNDEDKTDSAEKAIAAWKNAIAAARNGDDESGFRLALANFYKHLNRKEDAKKVISEQKDVPAQQESKLDRFLKTLSFTGANDAGLRASATSLILHAA